MSQFTKKAILDSFVRLLGKKPFNKITVKQIVDDCGVNRNTFYYYFDDIYALLDEFLHREAERIFAQEKEGLKKAFFSASELSSSDRHILYNLYNSETRDRLENYCDSVVGYIMANVVRDRADKENVSEREIMLIADFCKNAVVGMILERLRNNTEVIVDEEFSKVEKLIDVFIETALQEKNILQ